MTSTELVRLPYSRSSFERVGHAVGEAYLARRERVEARLIEELVVPAEAASVSVSLDRTSVPMEEPIEREPKSAQYRKLKAAVKRQPKRSPQDRRTKAAIAAQLPSKNTAGRKVQRNYRMAYCATVTFHDADGRALHTIRYGRMPAEAGSVEASREVREMMERLRDDVAAIRAQRAVPVVLLADGASELWSLFARYLNPLTLGTAPVRLVDAWHALEYIAAAAKFLEVRNKAWPGVYKRWKTWLLTEPDGVHRVLRALRSAGLLEARDEDGRRPVGDAVRYLSNRTAQMAYADARAAGFPIGSGAVEATCKSLVSLRMKRPGSRWKHRTGNEVLQLRALQLSDRWSSAMTRTLKPLRRPVHSVSRAEALGMAA